METSDDDKTQRLLAASEPAENPIPTTSANPRNSEWYYPAPVASGLSSSDASRRLEHFGPNALEEKEVNIWLKFASYFWGPMPIMIWIAILIEFVNYSVPDVAILLVLQTINGLVGFVEEKNAGDAVAALKNSLTPKCTVKRDGRWMTMDSSQLVPGDVINLKLGDIIPADCKLLDGAPLQVDQAALTGESLPVTLYQGDSGKMGATVKRGEIEAHVTATGSETFFGKAASMVNSVENVSRFQKIMFKISMFLLSLAVIVVSVIMCVLLNEGVNFLRCLGICVVLLVASIPIAMQVVSASTMAVGARRLADNGVIISRLGSIEEMAGMNMLCSDKTGTLTQNKLKLFEPIVVDENITDKDLIFYAALAAKRMEEGQDAIDLCVTNQNNSDPSYAKKIETYTELDFVPFDPTSKKTVATVRSPGGETFKTCKGMTNIVLDMCQTTPETRRMVVNAVQDLADRGYRALGVAKTNAESGDWEFLGVLSLFDPPREDTKDTIAKAQQMGISVKMVTGDQVAIAKETCRSLGMGAGILDSSCFHEISPRGLSEIVRDAHGFAEVYPEHKFEIVKMLMDGGFTCGMTGDGVNDAPALKRAHIGIAVEGATDAARAAADIVLTDPGLSTIIDAILRARKIFARVRNYCIYRIAATLQMVFFFFFAVIAFKGSVATSFPDSQRMVAEQDTLFGHSPAEAETVFTLPVMALVAITLLNDGLIISICKDKVVAAAKPQMWELREIFTVAFALGFVLVTENCLLLLIGMKNGPGSEAGQKCGQTEDMWTEYAYDNFEAEANTKPCEGFLAHWVGNDSTGTITYKQVKTMMYLSLSISGFLTVMAARTRGCFFQRRLGYLLMSATVVAFIITTVLANRVESISETLDMENLTGRQTVFVWCYVCIGFCVQDILVKRSVYHCYDWYKRDVLSAGTKEQLQAVISTQIEEERLTMRRTSASAAGMGLGRSGSGASRTSQGISNVAVSEADGGAGANSSKSNLRSVSFNGGGSGYHGGYYGGRSERESVLEAKIAKLQKELNEVKDILSRKKDKKV